MRRPAAAQGGFYIAHSGDRLARTSNRPTTHMTQPHHSHLKEGAPGAVNGALAVEVSERDGDDAADILPLRQSCVACTTARKRCTGPGAPAPCDRCVKFKLQLAEPCTYLIPRKRGPRGPTGPRNVKISPEERARRDRVNARQRAAKLRREEKLLRAQEENAGTGKSEGRLTARQSSAAAAKQVKQQGQQPSQRTNHPRQQPQRQAATTAMAKNRRPSSSGYPSPETSSGEASPTRSVSSSGSLSSEQEEDASIALASLASAPWNPANSAPTDPMSERQNSDVLKQERPGAPQPPMQSMSAAPPIGGGGRATWDPTALPVPPTTMPYAHRPASGNIPNASGMYFPPQPKPELLQPPRGPPPGMVDPFETRFGGGPPVLPPPNTMLPPMPMQMPMQGQSPYPGYYPPPIAPSPMYQGAPHPMMGMPPPNGGPYGYSPNHPSPGYANYPSPAYTPGYYGPPTPQTYASPPASGSFSGQQQPMPQQQQQQQQPRFQGYPGQMPPPPQQRPQYAMPPPQGYY